MPFNEKIRIYYLNLARFFYFPCKKYFARLNFSVFSLCYKYIKMNLFVRARIYWLRECFYETNTGMYLLKVEK